MRKPFHELDERTKGTYVGLVVVALDIAVLRRYLENETRIAVEFVLVALACAALVTAKHYRELVYWLCLVVFAILHVAIFMRIDIPVVFDAPVFSWLPLVVADIAVMMWSIEWMVGRFSKRGTDREVDCVDPAVDGDHG